MCSGRMLGTVAVALCLLSVAGATRASATADCKAELLAAKPSSVIASCSAVLQAPDLTREKRVEALTLRARAHYRTRGIEKAAQDFDAVLAIAPDDVDVLVSRASIDFRRAQFEQGVARLARAAEINPRHARLLRAIGALYDIQGDANEAIKLYGEALEIDPREPYALFLRSHLFATRKQYREALADADALVAIPPDVINQIGYIDPRGRPHDFHVVALTHRARLLADTGRHADAQRDLDRAVAFTPSAYALLERATYRMNRREREAALKDVEAGLAIENDFERLHYTRGLLLLNLERFEDALSAFDRAVALREDYSSALFLRARVRRHFGQTDRAVEDMIAAHRHDPGMIKRTMYSLRHAGFWPSKEAPDDLTPEFVDAIRACMLEPTCN